MNDQSSVQRHALPLSFFKEKSNYHWFVVATVCIGAFMAALDGSIITVALPTIDQQFNVNVSASAWVALAYLLTLTALLAMFGRIADIVGRRPLYTIGFTVFIIGSALCGAAPTLGFLVASRVLQGIGATMLQANSVAIVTAAVPERVRGKAIGIQGSALAVGLSLGPAIGGLLIGLFGWRSIFYVNVPVGIIGTTLAAMILPRDKHQGAGAVELWKKFDFPGAAIMAFSLVLLLLGLNQGNDQGWGSPLIIGYFVVGVALAVLFIIQEKRHSSPLLDLNLFKIPQLTWGNITGSLSYGVMYGVLYIIPYFFELVLKKPSSQSGILTTPLPIGMMLLTPIAGTIADKLGSKIPTVAGMAVATLGTVLLVFINDRTGLPYIIVALFLVGVGMGVFTPPNNSSVMGSTPQNRLGVSSGMLNMARSLGQSVGIAYAFAIFQGVILIYHFTPHNAPLAPLVTGFRWTFIGVTLFGVAALLISLFRGNVEKVKLPDEMNVIEL
ncbi:MAG: MFS transporter [Bacilli bacterium]